MVDACSRMVDPPEVYDVGVDLEDVTKFGKSINRGNNRLKTCMNYIWGKWYASIPNTRGWKGQAVKAVFGTNPELYKREQSRLSGLAKVYKTVPPDAWELWRSWAYYEKISRFWDYPFRQRYWIDKKYEAGDNIKMDEELIELNKVNVVHHKRKPLPDKPGYNVFDTSTGEIFTIPEFNKIIEGVADE